MSALTKRRGFSIGSNKSSSEEKTEVIDANNTGDATKKDANRYNDYEKQISMVPGQWTIK